MRFAIFSSMGNTTWSDVATLWRHSEETGWDAACVTDHFMPNTPDRVGHMLEPEHLTFTPDTLLEQVREMTKDHPSQ